MLVVFGKPYRCLFLLKIEHEFFFENEIACDVFMNEVKFENEIQEMF
jgi:hypothetical protein